MPYMNETKRGMLNIPKGSGGKGKRAGSLVMKGIGHVVFTTVDGFQALNSSGRRRR